MGSFLLKWYRSVYMYADTNPLFSIAFYLLRYKLMEFIINLRKICVQERIKSSLFHLLRAFRTLQICVLRWFEEYLSILNSIYPALCPRHIIEPKLPKLLEVRDIACFG